MLVVKPVLLVVVQLLEITLVGVEAPTEEAVEVPVLVMT